MKKDARKLLFVQKNFLGLASAKESIDLALAAAGLEFHVSLFFIGDGVFQLINSENNRLMPLLTALPFYDIQKIYVSQESLSQRQLLTKDLAVPVICLLSDEISILMHEYDTVVS